MCHSSPLSRILHLCMALHRRTLSSSVFVNQAVFLNSSNHDYKPHLVDLDSRLGLARDGDVEAFMRRLVVLSLRLSDQAIKAVGSAFVPWDVLILSRGSTTSQ